MVLQIKHAGMTVPDTPSTKEQRAMVQRVMRTAEEMEYILITPSLVPRMDEDSWRRTLPLSPKEAASLRFRHVYLDSGSNEGWRTS